MYLEKLEIQGFKSFAKPATLVFNRELTAIVGPNGSGKSNTADAVRWVLGEQSSKTLRGKKADDVIFAGSDKKGRLGYAQVDLFLNNKDKQADVDYEQIVISRKIDRKGESEYLVNNNKVRLLDIQLLLAKANFGQKTYSVIGQGMIDSILTSSAAERKEFFDEATGVKQFQMKKEQAEHKLDRSRENLEQSGQVLAELEPRLRSLTRQVKRLERREELQKELHDLKTDYYSFLSNNLNEDLAGARKDFDRKQSEVADLNQKLIELQTKLEKEEHSESRHDSFSSLQNKLLHIQNELNSLTREKTILEGQADLKLMSSGQADTVWLKKRIEGLTNEINRDKLQLKEKQNKLQSKQKELHTLEDKQKLVLKDFHKLEEQMASPSGELASKELKEKLDTILRDQQEFLSELEKTDTLEALDKIKSIASKVTQGIRDLWQRLKNDKPVSAENWKDQFNKLLTSKDTLVSEMSDLRTHIAVAENDIEKLHNRIEENESEYKKLSAQKQSLVSGDKATIGKEISEIEKKLSTKNKEAEEIEKQIKSFNEEQEAKKKTLVDAQKSFREVQHSFNIKNNELNDVKVTLARYETKQEDLNREIGEEIPDLKIKKVSKINQEEIHGRINQLKMQLQQIGGIDEVVVEEFKEVKERHDFLSQQSEDLEKAIDHLNRVIKDLDESISKQFDKSFQSINKLFDKYFKKLFNGGKAELILNIKEIKEGLVSSEDDDEDDEEEFDENDVTVKKQYGIDIKATPPGKKLSGINMLSGGEKALTSIALICAIIATNPSPFVVLDEVDAALDEANSERFVEILDELSEKTQFIAITHNRATMHKARIIYGVTMGDDGISKLLSINFDEADELAA